MFVFGWFCQMNSITHADTEKVLFVYATVILYIISTNYHLLCMLYEYSMDINIFSPAVVLTLSLYIIGYV